MIGDGERGRVVVTTNIAMEVFRSLSTRCIGC